MLIQRGVGCQSGVGRTDEQHRFGVNQRKVLREKKAGAQMFSAGGRADSPDALAITAYGEMDVSIIDELPAGRIPIETRWVRPGHVDSVLDWV